MEYQEVMCLIPRPCFLVAQRGVAHHAAARLIVVEMRSAWELLQMDCEVERVSGMMESRLWETLQEWRPQPRCRKY
jgi:hypothetical protein